MPDIRETAMSYPACLFRAHQPAERTETGSHAHGRVGRTCPSLFRLREEVACSRSMYGRQEGRGIQSGCGVGGAGSPARMPGKQGHVSRQAAGKAVSRQVGAAAIQSQIPAVCGATPFQVSPRARRHRNLLSHATRVQAGRRRWKGGARTRMRAGKQADRR